jgi:hypothetical protein
MLTVLIVASLISQVEPAPDRQEPKGFLPFGECIIPKVDANAILVYAAIDPATNMLMAVEVYQIGPDENCVVQLRSMMQTCNDRHAKWTFAKQCKKHGRDDKTGEESL